MSSFLFFGTAEFHNNPLLSLFGRTMSAKSTVTVDTGDSTGAKEQVQRKLQPKLKGLELQNAVQKQAEFYLSRDNLQNDAYLVSQMDANLFVPLHTIANFPKIANLTKEIKVVLKVLLLLELAYEERHY